MFRLLFICFCSIFFHFFWDTSLLSLFKLLAVFVHEICHMMSALWCGATVSMINITENEGGITSIRNLGGLGVLRLLFQVGILDLLYFLEYYCIVP